MKKGTIILLIVGIVVLLSVGVVAYVYSLGYGQDTFVTVHYYDSNQKEIFFSKGLSVIGNLEGVEYISFDVNVDNTGEVPLELKIKSASPSLFKSALPTTTLNLAIGESGKWTSNLIATSYFEGTTQIFEVTVIGSYIYAGQTKTLEKSGAVSLSIQPDPIAGFDVTVISSADPGGDTDPICTESWTCGEWEICTNNQQIRECTDANNCGTTNVIPDIVRSCSDKTVVFRISNPDFTSGWIMYKGVGYGFAGTGYSSGGTPACENYPFPGLLDLSEINSGYWLASQSSVEEIRLCKEYRRHYRFTTTEPEALDAITTTEPTSPYAENNLEIYQ